MKHYIKRGHFVKAMQQFSVSAAIKYIHSEVIRSFFFPQEALAKQEAGKQRQQRKLLVDTESGSIRLHRPLPFDPPWEKMKGKAKQGRTGTWKDGSKEMPLKKCQWF